jgi:hypothetical protein
MSVKVDLDQLANTLADFTFGYLITVGDDYRAHTVAVDPVLNRGVLEIEPVGKTARRNVTVNDAVTVIWPPREPGGYTLIVDGRAQLSDTSLTIAPQTAVLHRRAAQHSPAAKTGCGDDCVPLGSS